MFRQDDAFFILPYNGSNYVAGEVFLQMVSVAQWLEHWTVAPGVGGSSPLTHPRKFPLQILQLKQSEVTS